MSNRTKVVIAVCLITAIAGLIVLDLALSSKATRPTESSTSAVDHPNLLVEPRTGPIILTENPPASEPVREPEKPAPAPQKGAEVVQDKPKETPKPAPQPSATGGTTYQIQPGDSLWKIAQQHYGDGSLYTLIEKANPTLGKLLRVGTSIVIPPKPATVEKGAGQVAQTNGKKDHPTGSDKPMAAIPAGKKTYTVQPGDSLWKIAEAQKPKNINAYMDELVKANPDKLKSKNTPLRVGWILILPD